MVDAQAQLSVEQVAQLCHVVNKELCWLLGDYSQPPFNEAPEWQVESAIQGVYFRLMNPDVTPEQMHDNWSKQKVADGWVYGPIKCPERKSHPCLIPYHQLGPEQKLKDFLFSAVVGAVKAAGMAPPYGQGEA